MPQLRFFSHHGAFFSLSLLALFALVGCGPDHPPADLKIETEFGDVYVRLSDSTPQHKARLLSDVESGRMKGSMVFRVVERFMIQCGIPSEKVAADSTDLLEPEIKPGLHHIRGAVAIPRHSDDVNPRRLSAPLQFYIVTGEKQTDEDIDAAEAAINEAQLKNEAVLLSLEPEHRWLRNLDYEKLKRENPDSLDRLNQELIEKLKRRHKPFAFSESARKAYRESGGAPTLDAQYTVVGTVVRGMENVDKLSKMPTHQHSERPVRELGLIIKKVASH